MLNEPAVIERLARFRRGVAVVDSRPPTWSSSADRLPSGAPLGRVRLAHPRSPPPTTRRSSSTPAGRPCSRRSTPRPAVVKPNAAELRECTDQTDPVAAARELADRWQVTVVASLGSDGLVAVDAEQAWRARPGARRHREPDRRRGRCRRRPRPRAAAAGTSPQTALADCVALAAAAVHAPAAGELDLADYERHRSAARGRDHGPGRPMTLVSTRGAGDRSRAAGRGGCRVQRHHPRARRGHRPGRDGPRHTA